jgi:hypothetical protein
MIRAGQTHRSRRYWLPLDVVLDHAVYLAAIAEKSSTPVEDTTFRPFCAGI